MRRYRVGLIGTGASAGMHATALRQVPEAEVVAVLGTSAEKAADFAAKWEIPRAYSQIDDLLADADVDAVHLCTPPDVHESHAVAAAAAGKHLLIDKPIARTVEEADRIIAAARRGGVTLGAMFQYRFMPLSREVKAAVESGHLGPLHLADCYVKWWRDPAYYQGSSWRGTRAREGGGALINQAIHMLDLLLWLAGPVVQVSGYCGAFVHPIEMEDLGVAVVRFASGAVGVVEGSTAVYPGFSARLELHGARGSVVLDEGNGTIDWFVRGEEPRRTTSSEQRGGSASDPLKISYVGHVSQFRDFYQAIAEERAPLVDGAEGRRALEVVQAIHRSQETGKPVDLPLR